MCSKWEGIPETNDNTGYFIEFPDGIRIDLDEPGDDAIFYLNTGDDWYTEAKLSSLHTRIAWLLEEV